MSTKTPNHLNQDQVDLKTISSGMSKFFAAFLNGLFNILRLIKRKLIWTLAIVIVGFSAGYFLDSFKTYKHHLMVRPNFGSVDYLYSQVELIQSKIEEKDTVFLKSIGIKNPRTCAGISIKPIVDVYTFVNRNELNFKTLELLAEDGDLNTIVEANTTSKNYTYHLIEFITIGKTKNQNTVLPLIDYFNQSDYFKKIQKETLSNIQSKIATNERAIAQIDAILESIPKTGNPGPGGTIVSGQSQLNDVIKTKDLFIEEQGLFKIELVSLDKIIKLGTTTLNIEQTKGVKGKIKFIMPLLLLALFGLGYQMKSFYRG